VVVWRTEGRWLRYQSISPALVSQTATISGRAAMSRRCSQRAAAEANSRPMRPQPMMPKRMVRMAQAILAMAASTVAPSWTMAMRAAVMPAGFAWWITLRP
jgi:hypothetical protein